MSLTKEDIQNIGQLLDDKLANFYNKHDMDGKFEDIDTRLVGMDERIGSIALESLELKKRLESLAMLIDLLPTKDEFFTRMDNIAGNYHTFNQESIILAGRLSNHEERITDLENKRPT